MSSASSMWSMCPVNHRSWFVRSCTYVFYLMIISPLNGRSLSIDKPSLLRPACDKTRLLEERRPDIITERTFCSILNIPPRNLPVPRCLPWLDGRRI
ncbi:hypothetical protein BKA82DRAFT_3251578 [Pisolithus tinctorius]|nr:hypothetical protein BKA82DRAFT_3251578 [Pisolithus tinctorius]